MEQDTIVAIATPPGEGGLGVVRMSGPEAIAFASRLFRPMRPGPLRSYRLRYGHVVDPASGLVIDEVLVAVMRAPQSFTREDVVEFSCHGGPLPVQQTLQCCLDAGARLARPGEFTLRAFLHGRIDLSQAEATLDVIRAQTDAGLALAQAQLGGWLAREVRAVRAVLLDLLAYVTVIVDFPEDEVEPQDIGPRLRTSLQTVTSLLEGAHQGLVYRHGARVAIVGQPNVGKSSLLNALLRSDRAIVTPVPGTTRDTLEETANLNGIPVVLIDTAGIHASNDLVERLGIERSRAALAQADLALLVFDASRPVEDEDLMIARLTADKPTLLVWNKLDQQHPAAPLLVSIAEHLEHPRLAATVATSVATGEGLETLVQSLVQVLLGGHAPLAAGEARLVSNPRHHDALRRAYEYLAAALAGWDANDPTDLLGGDLLAALNALGEITGESVGDDLLDLIFSQFCIGK